jgi:hypothetical protein
MGTCTTRVSENDINKHVSSNDKRHDNNFISEYKIPDLQNLIEHAKLNAGNVHNVETLLV